MDSQPLPLTGFPPIHFHVETARPLTSAEAAELALRERVRAYRREHPVRRGFRRVAFAVVMSVLCLPTVERIAIHFYDGSLNEPSVAAQAS